MLNTESGQQNRLPNNGSGRVSTNVSSPRIVPNRRQLDNRFPVLGFTVYTEGLDYFEVLLTTDPNLFDPANAGRRNANNFYASRQDSGLIKALGASSIYLVPTAVLRSFAQTQPHPSAIFYTLIAYRGPDGSEPVFAHPPQTLPTKAPSVAIARDFKGQTLSSVLGILPEKLRRVTAPTDVITSDNNGRMGSSSLLNQEMAVDAESDMVEGEDGFNQESDEVAQEMAVDAESDMVEGEDGFDQEPEKIVQETQESQINSSEAPGESSADLLYHSQADPDFAYDDGYGPMPETSSLWDQTQESNYSATPEESEALENQNDLFDDDGYDDDVNFSSYEETETPLPETSSLLMETQESVYPPETGGPETLEDEANLLNEDVYDDYEEDYEGETEPAYLGHAVSEYGDEADTLDWEGTELTYESLEAPAAQPLSIEDKKRIIERIGAFESGQAGFAAINPDGEFAGRFGTNHRAYQRYHIGLSYGIIQFTQDSGNLGHLLVMMRNRDTAAFNRIFGADADELIRVTTAQGDPSKKSPGGRSARVQPVAGADLWQEPWLSRFREAAQHRPFQAAQNELAARLFIDPMLPFAGRLGLDTDRALTMVVDRAVQLGGGGARRWIIEAVGPVKTASQRQQALAALGFSTLREFQKATPGLAVDGAWGPKSHAAMVAALRNLENTSPIQIPTREQMMDAMVRHAEGRRWAHRVQRLRNSSEFTDTAYQLM